MTLFTPSGHPPLGAHVSVAGGLDRAFERGRRLACESLQIFVKSPGQWASRRLTEDEVAAFRAARQPWGVGRVVAHAAYLINLASPDAALRARSRRALGDELDRCERLGIDALVVHPGAHMGRGEAAGIAAVARSLDAVLGRRRASSTSLLLENTAGQGTVLGHRLEHLAAILERIRVGGRVGICVDVCHAFAAGYPLHRKLGWEAFLKDLERLLGFARVGCVHVNDSQAPFASRRDRHANIGRGRMGLAAFRRLLAEPRLATVPMILETPRGPDGEGHARDLRRLRDLARDA